MNGIVVIDKPAGISSFKVVQIVRRICGVKKAGHTGTLDPMATGLLVVCLGRATKLVQFMMNCRKAYEGMLQFGIVTDTYDSEGNIISETDVPDSITLDNIKKIVSRSFVGRLRQNPPAFSALKYGGTPLYKLARQGINIVKEAREIDVYRFDLLDFVSPFCKFYVECSSGTYVRSLVYDLGKELKVGATMTRLRRTKNGPFDISNAVTIETLEKAAASNSLQDIILPPEVGVSHIMSVYVSSEEAEHIRHGRPVAAEKVLKEVRDNEKKINKVQKTLPYITLYTKEGGSTLFVAIAVKPHINSDRIETLKVWN